MTDRRAVLETEHDVPALVAAALAPDNTASIRMRVEGALVRTEIERGTTGGLQSSVDDCVVNLTVAETVHATATHHQRHHE